jgi:hypothetical protein
MYLLVMINLSISSLRESVPLASIILLAVRSWYNQRHYYVSIPQIPMHFVLIERGDRYDLMTTELTTRMQLLQKE